MVISARPDEVGWVQPPQLHPQMSVALIQYFESKIESISGMTAIVRGFMGNGRNAQGVMDSVQDAAFVRIRATLRELERTLRGVTWKKAATIAEFYTEPRFMRSSARTASTPARPRQRHFYTRPTRPVSVSRCASRSWPTPARSSRPRSRPARAEADTLFALGAIDVLELLKAKQWPNYAIVAKRVMEAQAAQGMAGGVTAPGKRERARA
jgi:hypothetical protein